MIGENKMKDMKEIHMEELESGTITVVWNGEGLLIDTLLDAVRSLDTSIIELEDTDENSQEK